MIGWSWGRVWEARKGSFSIWENRILKKREQKKNKKYCSLQIGVCVVGTKLIGDLKRVPFVLEVLMKNQPMEREDPPERCLSQGPNANFICAQETDVQKLVSI